MQQEETELSQSRPAVFALVALLGIGCASAEHTAPASELAEYHRLFLTMPSHADGFGMSPATLHSDGAGPSTVQRAFTALRFELIDAGFDVVGPDQDADAILELTIGGIGPNGEAERAFVAFRDADRGRLLWVFRAQARRDPPAVEELMAPIGRAIEEKVAGAVDPAVMR